MNYEFVPSDQSDNKQCLLGCSKVSVHKNPPKYPGKWVIDHMLVHHDDALTPSWVSSS